MGLFYENYNKKLDRWNIFLQFLKAYTNNVIIK